MLDNPKKGEREIREQQEKQKNPLFFLFNSPCSFGSLEPGEIFGGLGGEFKETRRETKETKEV